MTEAELRNLVADTALEYLGCNEADGTHKPIIDLYNEIRPLPRGYKMTYRDPWCAAFPSAVGWELKLSDFILPECSCDAMINLYKARGLWREADDYIPKVADLIMYDWSDSGYGDNLGGADHVGIVYAKSGKSLTIIEGNISDSVNFRTINVNARYIRGYCTPDYASAAKALSGEAASEVILPKEGEKNSQEEPVSVKLPRLNEGDTGGAVEAMQILLIGYGFRCGPDGADGDFGPNTAKALKKYQNDRGLAADAVCGADTWSRLLGL